MARYPQQHSEILNIPMVVLAMDTIGHLPIISKGKRWALRAICLHTCYVFAVPMKEKSVESVVQAYLSDILALKGGSMVILSDNGTEFKNKVLNEVCDQSDIKRLFSNPFHPQDNAKMENVHNFLKRTLTKFLDNSNLKWDELLPFACYCYNIFPGSNGMESAYFLMLRQDPVGIMTQMKARLFWKNCTNYGSTKPTTSKKCIKETSTWAIKIAIIPQNLKLTSQSWSRTMHVTHLN